MVQWLAPAFSRGDSYAQIVLDFGLPDEVIKMPWSQAGIKWYVFTAGFTRYNASYFGLAPLDVFNSKQLNGDTGKLLCS